ncbi:hypothetical protein LEP1GSC088_3814 [Leptospira interrogans str. L1207]|nr:hypothetical protein LEP1GSC088_3814 [Leptospira interrogans str. L1207]
MDKKQKKINFSKILFIKINVSFLKMKIGISEFIFILQ